jgi:hypothetical protein
MTASVTREIGNSPRPKKVEEGFAPTSGTVVPPPMKRRGPIIAGGIIRFSLGANEER